MKLIWYLMMFVFGFLGVGGALRSAELMAAGGQVNAVQLSISLVLIAVAGACMLRARGPKAEEQ
jgi:hypothetical protein